MFLGRRAGAVRGVFTLTVDSDVLPFTFLQHNWVIYEGLDSARGLGESLGGALPTIFFTKSRPLTAFTLAHS